MTVPALPHSPSDDQWPAFADVRGQVQSEIFAHLPERIARLSWTSERLRDWQHARLSALLAYATERSAFHSRRLGGVDPNGIGPGDLSALPVMTKAEMMADFDSVITDQRVTRAAAERALAGTSAHPVPLPGGHMCMATGGSSGQRGIFAYSPAALAEAIMMIFRTRVAVMAAAGGVGAPGTRSGPGPLSVQIPATTIAMVGAPSAVHGTMLVPSLLAGSPINFVHAPVTLPVPEIVGRLNDLQPDALFGYPSMLARLAGEQNAGRLAIAPKLVNCTAEMLLPHARAAIRGAFGAPVMNTFATSEGLIGSSGPDDQTITLGNDGCIVELVDAGYRPVPPGCPSEKVLVTNLYNYLQPLIRYELGDSFTQQPDSAACGHMQVTVEGRSDDMLRYPSAEVHPLVLRSVLTTTPEVLDYHAQQTRDGIALSLLTDRPADLAALTRRLRSALARAGLPDAQVSIATVTELPRHPETGKLRRVTPLA